MTQRTPAPLRALALLLLGSLALASCQSVQTTQSGTVGVDRRQAMMLSSTEVNKASVQAYQQTLKEAAKKGAFEVEADRIGVELAARAGYDPRAAITLWQKMG